MQVKETSFLKEKIFQNFDFCVCLSKSVLKHGATWKGRHAIMLQMRFCADRSWYGPFPG